MRSGAQGRHRKRWLLAGGGASVVVLVVAAVVVRRVVLADHARAVPVAVAVKHFRASDPGGAEVSTLVESGIYRYRTTGEESVDALGGATHKYPAETTITVTPDGCGVLLRWDVLQERRDEWRLCTTAQGIEVQPQGLQFHEFYGRADSEAIQCQHSALVVANDTNTATQPLELWPCTLGGDPWTPTWQILGPDQVMVAGTNVPVVHVRMTVADDSQYDEHTTVDWDLDRHGLPVKVTSTKESKSPSPIGAVTYHESYTINLETLTPLR